MRKCEEKNRYRYQPMSQNPYVKEELSKPAKEYETYISIKRKKDLDGDEIF